jgi:phage-related protein
LKIVEFRGSSLEDLRSFHQSAMREAGFQIDRIQRGLPPSDFKPMSNIGKAVAEIRIFDESEFRGFNLYKINKTNHLQ